MEGSLFEKYNNQLRFKVYISAFKKIVLYIDRLLANNAIERKIFFDWLAPLLL